MPETQKLEGMLSPYRVLDLTDEKGSLCGKLLGDLGADVIKVEKPGGDPARKFGPFYHDEVDPEKSLLWFAFNTSKRGITLDIEAPEGQAAFKKLVKTADFVLESFPPGFLDKLGLGYSTLETVNPGVILVSITPFGQSGPYRDYKAPDIVAWAMGGQMYACGDADRPPIRISQHSQSYLQAAARAAAGALMALHFRNVTGEGQQVDVSIQECVAQVTYAVMANWDMLKVNQLRQNVGTNVDTRMMRVWPCKDGYVVWHFWSGPAAKRWNAPLVEWMEGEGMVDDFFRNFDWAVPDWHVTDRETIDHLRQVTGKFFLAHSKSELLEGAVKHHAMLFPVSSPADILGNVQLAAREFWVKLEHPELGSALPYPGAFARTSEAQPRISRRAPLIGEHNREILGEEPAEVMNRNHSSDRTLATRSTSRKPLEGIKVVDFGQVFVGPITTKALADCGAQVIKIEGRTRIDPVRSVRPFKDGIPGLNRAGWFTPVNTGKLSVALNLRLPRGVEIARRFVAWADVVVENFAGCAMERMGLGYEQLKKVNPGIIMLSSCMHGQTGPYAAHPGFGPHLTALSGFYEITGWPDREPSDYGAFAYTDFIAPNFNITALLAALDYRRRTNKGLYIDMSQYENAVHFMSPVILDYVANHRMPQKMGNRSEYAVPHGAFRCRGEDRWCAIAVIEDEDWRNFCQVLGNPAWTCDRKFADLKARKDNEDELDKLVEGWSIRYSPEEIMRSMQSAGVAAGVVETGQDMMERDPQFRHRRSFTELDHPEVGRHCALGPSFLLSKSPWRQSRAPMLGEHNEYALKEVLGMSDDEIAQLVMDGVVE